MSEELLSDNSSEISTGSDSSRGTSTLSDNMNLLERNEIQKFFLHLQLLLQKAFLNYSRNWRSFVMTSLCPILWCLFIIYINNKQYTLREIEVKTGIQTLMKPIPKCFG